MSEMKWTKTLALWLSTLIVGGAMIMFAVISGHAGAQDEADAPAESTQTESSESAETPDSAPATSDVEGPFLTESEKQAAIQFLKNKEKIERILGPGQVFYYEPNRLRHPFKDPMIIPWSYINQILPQLVAESKTMINQGRLDEAESQLKDININFPNNPFKDEIVGLLQTIEEIRIKSVPGQITPTPTPIFPAKILNDTRAILYSEDEPLVLIGDDVLKPGDTVPWQGDVITIKSIEPNRVEFDYRGVIYEKVIDALGQSE